VGNRTDPKVEEFASGWLTPLMLAAREGDPGLVRLVADAGADVNAAAGDGKTALALAIFNGNYDVASLLVDRKADVNKADAQRFTPLFWAVDRRKWRRRRTSPGWPRPIVRSSASCDANPSAFVNNTRGRMREGRANRLCHRAHARGFRRPQLVKLLLERGGPGSSRATAKPWSRRQRPAFIRLPPREAAGTLQVVKQPSAGSDVNQADDHGITPLMAAEQRRRHADSY
jgi:ankyrin repeat protein